jgi:RNA polymerase sigma factor (sigma-70 family)
VTQEGCSHLFIISLIQTVKDIAEDIFKKYLSMMKNLSFSILRDFHLSEDAVQRAMLNLHLNREKIDNIDSKESKNYIYTVTKNEALKILREEKRKKEHEVDVQSYDENGLTNIAGQLDVEVFCNEYGFGPSVAEALESLVEEDRDIIVYKYGAGYSLKEIAVIMDMSKEAVYKRHQRALDKVGKALEAKDE